MKKWGKRILGWKGWKKFFPLPAWVAALLFVLCGSGLVWVFASGREQWWPAYVLYFLSAYLLAALCVRLPEWIRLIRKWIEAHPVITGMLKDSERKMTVELYLEQALNFSYGIFKTVAGVVIGSAWIGCDGIYNLAQALIQLFQIMRRRKPGMIQDQWKSYRFCGVLILLMHLTLTGIVFQTVNWNRVDEQGEIMIIATAAFAFYKIISSFLEIAKDRKHIRPIDSSVRMLKLAQAGFAIFSLQAGMLHTFGTGEKWEYWTNFATGCAVCLLTAAMGVYMICRANREIRTIQEKENGTECL